MFSKLVFIIDGEEIEFHAHELVKIAQQLVNEVQIAPAHVPDYESYPANLHKKRDKFLIYLTLQYWGSLC